MKTTEFIMAADALLGASQFKDYGPNGLQVEGKSEIRHVVSGVTASLALIEAAVQRNADALFVHHGLFWRGQSGVVTGWMRKRLALLLEHSINLIAYHLPLDAHTELGNNAQLGRLLGLKADTHFSDYNIGFMADAGNVNTVDVLAHKIEQSLHRKPTILPGDRRTLKRIAWCSGGAQGYFEAAVAAGADVYITGEISEPQAHLARETGVAFIAAGHHATERYGAPAVAAFLTQRFGLTHEFIDIDNPA
jgi:dinuclear metal center YbgI/SA1388 family protein